ncbi:MAG TPA: ABC transporter permease, partial [Pyrinomonadaceae bacterium]|nr:ABC transporter permease [Pyrinomonadaceae bacterium]
MRIGQLLKRNLSYFWRTNLAVVLGVATAVAVLAGALLVGDSVRSSLRDLFLQRLGNTDSIVTSSSFFRDQLAADIQNDERFRSSGFTATCPLIAADATVKNEATSLRASGVRVYGVDDRFWNFHQRNAGGTGQAPRGREVLVSEAIARELQTAPGNDLVVNVQKPSDIPVESLHGRKEDLSSTLRLTVRGNPQEDTTLEFSVQPQQGAVRAVFVPLELLQRQLDQDGKVNLILLANSTGEEDDRNQHAMQITSVGQILNDRVLLEDFGLKLRLLDAQQSISVEHESKVLNDTLATAARKAAEKSGLRATSVFSYLANGIGAGERSIPYSLVTALDEKTFDELKRDGAAQQAPNEKPVVPPPGEPAGSQPPPIILNEWAARDLGVSKGSVVTLEYYLWQESGRLETRTAPFQVVSITPIAGLAADKDLVPEYPGITGSENLSEWDPPFPVDL